MPVELNQYGGIHDFSDCVYQFNGELDIISPNRKSGWDLVAQELRVMMISDENSIGDEPDLAIDIRRFADTSAGIEGAEIIQDWIEEKIAANPLFDGLDLMVEIVPLDHETMEIVFKHPDTDDPNVETYVDLEFSVKIDITAGVISGFLDEGTVPNTEIYTADPTLITEFKKIKKSTTLLDIDYIPIDERPILLYNIEDLSISNGQISAESQTVNITIDVLPKRTYPLVDYTDVDLDRFIIEDYVLKDGSGIEAPEDSYGLVNNNLLIPSNSSLSGTYTLTLTVAKRYANIIERNRIERRTNLSIYPFFRVAEYKLVTDRVLEPGTYVLQYYIYRR